MRCLAPLLLLLLIGLSSCKNEEKQLWIEHTMRTIQKGNEALEQLGIMRKLLSSEQDLGEEEFKLLRESKLELEYLVEETANLVADNPAQVTKLDKVKRLLFKTYFMDLRELAGERAKLLERVNEIEGLIDSYIKTEEELLELRKKA